MRILDKLFQPLFLKLTTEFDLCLQLMNYISCKKILLNC